MAPLFVSCDKLSHTYSPFTTRGMHSLPGKQGRNVPFVRPTKSISRANIVVTAAPEHVLDTNNDKNKNGAGDNGSRALDEEYSAGLLAVHGGELSGRPKVSGTYDHLMETIDWYLDPIYWCGLMLGRYHRKADISDMCACRFFDHSNRPNSNVYIQEYAGTD